MQQKYTDRVDFVVAALNKALASRQSPISLDDNLRETLITKPAFQDILEQVGGLDPEDWRGVIQPKVRKLVDLYIRHTLDAVNVLDSGNKGAAWWEAVKDAGQHKEHAEWQKT